MKRKPGMLHKATQPRKKLQNLVADTVITHQSKYKHHDKCTLVIFALNQ